MHRFLEQVYCCGAASSWKGISKSTALAMCKACKRPRKVTRVTDTESKAKSRIARSAWEVTTVSAARMSAWSWLRDTKNNCFVAITVWSVPIWPAWRELRWTQRLFGCAWRLGLQQRQPINARRFGACGMVEMSGEKRRSQLVRVGKSRRCCCCVVWVGPEQVFWRAARNREILRLQIPLSYPSYQKKQCRVMWQLKLR